MKILLDIVLAVLVLAVMVGFMALFVGALVSVLRSRLSGGMKLVWSVLVFIAPVLGAVLWFLIGRKQATASAVARYGT